MLMHNEIHGILHSIQMDVIKKMWKILQMKLSFARFVLPVFGVSCLTFFIVWSEMKQMNIFTTLLVLCKQMIARYRLGAELSRFQRICFNRWLPILYKTLPQMTDTFQDITNDEYNYFAHHFMPTKFNVTNPSSAQNSPSYIL